MAMQAPPVRLPYTVAEVAAMYGKSRNTILREIASGRLPAKHKKGETKRWYITDEALEEWARNYAWEG